MNYRFKTILLNTNTGFSVANIVGAREAKADWIVCRNPDAFAGRDWFKQVLYATNLTPNLTMVGSTRIMMEERISNDENGDFSHVSGLASRADCRRLRAEVDPIKIHKVFASCAAWALYDKGTFLRLGGFDETFFCHLENVNIGSRLRL